MSHQHRSVLAAAIAASAAAASAIAGEPGEILWTYTLEMESPGVPLVGPGGIILWAGTGASLGIGTGGLNALASDGSPLWHWPGGTNGVVSVADDGSIYSGDILAGGIPAVTKLSPEGSLLWQYPVPNMYEFIGGPDVGPDGNIYIAADVAFGNGPLISLTPGGQYRWELNGFSNYGGGNSHIVFSGERLFKIEGHTPIPTGALGSSSGLVAVTLSGQMDWFSRFNVGNTSAERQPTISPTTGFLHVAYHNSVRTYRPDGTIAWERYIGFSPQGMGVLAAGPEGNLYAVHGYRGIFAIDRDGDILWEKEFVIPSQSHAAPAVSPDGRYIAVVHRGDTEPVPPLPAGVVVFDAADGSTLWQAPLPRQGEDYPRAIGVTYSTDGSVLYISSRAIRPYPQIPSANAYLFAMATGAGASICYANCDASTAAPILNVADFTCFLQRFAAADPWANCDQSTTPPTLNVADFTCFLQQFAAGCP